jgi:NAD+ diphosphatase
MEDHPKLIFGTVPPEQQQEPAHWFVFKKDKLLVHQDPSALRIPLVVDLSELGLKALREQYLGKLDGRHCYSAEITEDADVPAGMIFEGLRQVYGRLDEDLFWLAARAVQIVDWDRSHQYCSRCGAPLKAKMIERAKECLKCGALYFPRLAPAIIVLVERGNQLLLARSRHFMSGMYSVIAGFVEPGETLEEAVVREVREEVGIAIKSIHYFDSQPWPFPHSLMIGFTATYAGGDISLSDSEIEDAGWFTSQNLPTLPGKISISRKLIDWFLAKHRTEGDSKG